MKAKELKEKSDKELKMMLTELREKRRDISFNLAQKQIKDTGSGVKIRKDIAKVLTILNERSKS